MVAGSARGLANTQSVHAVCTFYVNCSNRIHLPAAEFVRRAILLANLPTNLTPHSAIGRSTLEAAGPSPNRQTDRRSRTLPNGPRSDRLH